MNEPPLADNQSSEPPLGLPRRLRLSGKASAAALLLCLGTTAVLIPMALRMPRWVEYEIVLGVWWIIWLLVLTSYLYGGQRITDDHQLGQPRNWFASSKSQPARRRRDSNSSWWDGFFWGSVAFDAEGCIYGLAIIVALILLVGLIWFLIEIAIPVLFFLLYVIVRSMMAQVLNDCHYCRGRLARALAWGFVWATVYTAPLAAVVWFIHYVHERAPVR
jgi:hypothetical protein